MNWSTSFSSTQPLTKKHLTKPKQPTKNKNRLPTLRLPPSLQPQHHRHGPLNRSSAHRCYYIYMYIQHKWQREIHASTIYPVRGRDGESRYERLWKCALSYNRRRPCVCLEDFCCGDDYGDVNVIIRWEEIVNDVRWGWGLGSDMG